MRAPRFFAVWSLGLVAAVCLLATSASAGPIYEIDYAGYDVVLTDSKKIKTEVSEFGFWTGPNILIAKRGDAKVEIPFRKIKTLEISKYIPVKGYSPATVTTKRGKTYKLHIERFEGQRYMGGKTDFGSLRLRLMQISKLELKKLSHTEPSRPGQSGQPARRALRAPLAGFPRHRQARQYPGAAWPGPRRATSSRSTPIGYRST